MEMEPMKARALTERTRPRYAESQAQDIRAAGQAHQSELENLMHGLATVAERLRSHCGDAETIADRILGSRPETCSNDAPSPQPPGQLGALFGLATELDRLNARMGDALRRLQQL
ncbi:MAG: hypothetical protein J5J04_16585 [Anaerolineae bacterium]|nr:hypothetical protein [Anaerolineae bacterium]